MLLFIYTLKSNKRGKNLETPVLILFDEPTISIKILFPEAIRMDSLKGTIHFYRPNDSALDRTYKLELDEDWRQVIPVGDFEKGRWKLTLTW